MIVPDLSMTYQRRGLSAECADESGQTEQTAAGTVTAKQLTQLVPTKRLMLTND